MRKVWSEEEVILLIKSREDVIPYKDIALKLNRTIKSVQRKAQNLNIVKKEWSTKEVEILRTNIENGVMHKEISLSRTLQAIQRKASELNIRYDYSGNTETFYYA